MYILRKSIRILNMDELNLLLTPCLMPIKYKDIKNCTGNIKCMICGTHQINVEECLNTGVNKLAISQQKIEDDLAKIGQLKTDYFKDYEAKVNESFNIIKNKIDLRREILKKEISTKIDEYSLEMVRALEMEEKKILVSIKKMLEMNDLVDFKTKKEVVTNEQNVVQKINLTVNLETELKDKIKNIEWLANLINRGKQYVLHFTKLDLNLKKALGELKLNGLNDKVPVKNKETVQIYKNQVTDFPKPITTTVTMTPNNPTGFSSYPPALKAQEGPSSLFKSIIKK
ncbi:unnamed protein product [Brachionus calyciflorus]|uniref:Uncharacterized protein n=1 Tax=Brachionus calyciflorus TaxID=104777 RepID=A0A813MBU1_9BILA|nr:unnamed protein product [Brachionus calyciflorus]